MKRGTGQKENKENTIESKKRYQMVVDTQQEMISHYLPDTTLVFVNQAYCRTFGLSESELIGRKFIEHTPPDYREKLMEIIHSLTPENPVITHTHRAVLPDGAICWQEWTDQAIFNEAGEIIEYQAVGRDITGRVEAEQALRESEEKHRRLFETMIQGVVYQAEDGRIISANPAAERIVGLSFEQMQGKTSMDPRWQMIEEDGTPVSGNDHPAMIALRTGKTVGPVTRGVFHQEKKSHIWLNITAIPLFQPGAKKPFQVYATFEDITKRKAAEDQLKALSDNIPQGVIYQLVVDPDGARRFTYISAGVERLGVTQQEVLKNPQALYDRFLEEDLGVLMEAEQHSFENLTPFRCEARLRASGGEILWAQMQSSLKKMVDDSIICDGICFDITARKAAEDALAQSHDNMNTVLENALFGVVIIDRNRIIRWVNPVVCKMAGVETPEELIGNHCGDYLCPDEQTDCPILDHGQTLENSERILRRHDGQVIPILKTVDWITLEGEEVLLETFIDITARKKAEAELKRQAAERAAVDTFTHSVSNDLQAPLRRIEGFSEALQEECAGQLSGHAKDYLKRIVTQVGSMKNLTDALLQLSRVVSREIRKETTDLSALSRSNLEKLTYREPERQLELIVAPGICAEGDPELLNLMLGCLLDNAWKFTNGIERAQIEFGSTIKDGQTVFYIKDNGVGFDMKRAEKLFAPFQRLHSDDNYPGIGIGLNLVYRIISRHGGEIWAEGEPEKGACFYFTLS